MKILVIGGSRFVGPYLLELLVKHGHNVTAFNRGTNSYNYPKTVTRIVGDRDKGFNLKEKFDVVIDMCAFTGIQAKQVLNELSFDFLVHFGTNASYKLSQVFPITEEFPLGEWPSTGEYGIGKRECEAVLVKSKIKYSVLRPTYILGPNNYCDREHFIYAKIKKGEAVVIPGNGQSVNQFVFADEVARSLAVLAEKKVAGAFNCVGNDCITLTGLVEMMGKVMGIEPKISYNPKADGANYVEEEFPFGNENAFHTNDKIKKLGVTFVPLFEGLKRDYQSFYKNNI